MTEEQKQTCFELGLHQMTLFQMSEKLKSLLNVIPPVAFSGLKDQALPQVFFRYYGVDLTSGTALLVHAATRGGGQITVSYWPRPEKSKLRHHSGGAFIPMTPTLVNLLGVKHEDTVKAAVENKLEVPVEIRVLYPELFVSIPEKFPMDEVRRFLMPNLVRRNDKGVYTMLADLKNCIEKENNAIKALMAESTIVCVKDPSRQQDYDEYIDRRKKSVEFYRWLEPHLQKGGIFAPAERFLDEPLREEKLKGFYD